MLAQDINNTMLSIIPQVEKEKVFFRIENNNNHVELIGIITKTQRKGYAKECLHKVIQKILEDNKQIIVLYSNTKKLGNRALYESLGFEIIFEETSIFFE